MDSVYVLGDFNAHPPSTLFYNEMVQFGSEENQVCVDVEFIGVNWNADTYISQIEIEIARSLITYRV